MRSGQFARDYLQGWQGHLMVDDFSGYKALFRTGVTELGCWAHARRKLFDLHAANQSPIAAQALKWIAALYGIEKPARTWMCWHASNYANRKRSRSSLRLKHG